MSTIQANRAGIYGQKGYNFNFLIGGFLVLFAVITFIPFYTVIMASISDPKLVRTGEILLAPRGFTSTAYFTILKDAKFARAFTTTVTRTLFGTFINLALQATIAYVLSRRYLPGRKTLMIFVLIPMLFNAGIIPNFLLVRDLKIINTLWALLLPNAISTWNVIVLKSFFENIPDSLEEAAKIDGANDILIFFKIVLPLSTAALATITLFCAVTHWNAFMDAVIYLPGGKIAVLQLFLRDLILQFSNIFLMGDSVIPDDLSSLSLRSAAVIVSTIPIIVVYPSIQKHFMKGIMLGAIKG